jgi:hypothetical protein
MIGFSCCLMRQHSSADALLISSIKDLTSSAMWIDAFDVYLSPVIDIAGNFVLNDIPR